MRNEDKPFEWGDCLTYCNQDVIIDLEDWIEGCGLKENEFIHALVGFLSDVVFVSTIDPPREVLVSDLIKIIATSERFKHIIE